MIGNREKYFITAKKFGNEHVITGWFTKEELLEKLPQWEAQGYTVWASINDLEEGDKTIDGVKRYCDLWFDIDSKRKDKSQPAKPEEVLEARERANSLRTFLQERFHAKCFLAMSGNGIHIHCPFECAEVPKEKRRQLNENLQAFAKAVSRIAEAEIDHTYDTRRVTAIIGLKNQKITANPLETGWEKDLYDPKEGKDVKYALEEIKNARKQNTFLREIIMNYDTLSETLGLEKHEPTQPILPQTDKEFTPETKKKLDELRKKNPKLDALLNKRICIETEPATLTQPCEYKFKSRSEAEESLLVLLVCYGFSKSEIYYIMEHESQIGKWVERDDSYRDLSYNKAVNYCTKHKAQLLAEQQTTTQREHFNEITRADFVFENGHLYEILETPLLTIKIGRKKIKFIHEGKTIETKLSFDLNRLEKELGKANVTPEEIAYFKRVIQESIEKEFIITKLKGDSLPKFASIIADVFLENFHFATIEETDEILMYSNGVYKIRAETFIKKEIESLVPPETITENLIKEVLGHIRRSTYEKLEKFNADPYLLNLKNGILDIRTFEFKPHTPEVLSTMQIPVEYNPNAKCELWERVIQEDLYPEDIETLQEAFGYALFLDNRAQKMFVFLGSGSNGKSLILHVLETMLGKENVANISPQTLVTNEFALSELKDKLLNIYADLPNIPMQSVGRIKGLVSGDPITADKKYKDMFTFINRAKFFFSANQLPKVYDDTIAFYRRLVIINFPKTFDETQADPHLFEKLTTPEALSGIFNWSLEGLRRLIQNNFRFSYHKSVDELKELYTKASDPIKAFVEEEIVEDPEAWIPKQELYRAYVEYVTSHKLQSPVSQNTFFKSLPKYERATTEHKNVKGQRIWVFKGIRLKNEREKEEETENETLPFETQ